MTLIGKQMSNPNRINLDICIRITDKISEADN